MSKNVKSTWDLVWENAYKSPSKDEFDILEADEI